MKILSAGSTEGTPREVNCPRGGFVSRRMLLDSDGMGYTITHTTVYPGVHRWHYKHHYESCYCLSGSGRITDIKTGAVHSITPGVMYVLDDHDEHIFATESGAVLLCVFNPPLKGSEVHREDGSYEC